MDIDITNLFSQPLFLLGIWASSNEICPILQKMVAEFCDVDDSGHWFYVVVTNTCKLHSISNFRHQHRWSKKFLCSQNINLANCDNNVIIDNNIFSSCLIDNFTQRLGRNELRRNPTQPRPLLRKLAFIENQRQ